MNAYRAQAEVLRKLGRAMERKDHLVKPNITVHTGYKNKTHSKITFAIWGSSVMPYGSKEAIEKMILDIADLFPGTEWKKNVPRGNYDETYYIMTGKWHGADIEIFTERDRVCEKVVVMETEEEVEVPDPVLAEKAMEGVPLIKQIVKTPVLEWQCNEVIANATDPILQKREAINA